MKQINRARKEIEKQKQHNDSTGTSVGASRDVRRDSRAALHEPATIQATYSSTRPIPIRQAGGGPPGSPHPHSSFGQSYTDTSVFSTSESSNAIDNHMSSSYASNSSSQSWQRMPHMMQDRLPIDPGRISENEDLYDESAGLHRRGFISNQRLSVPALDRSRGALSSSEEEDEVDESSAQQSTSPMGSASLKSRLNPERVVLSGYLMKQGKRKNWRKRWFVLTSDKLLYARSHMVSGNVKEEG